MRHREETNLSHIETIVVRNAPWMVSLFVSNRWCGHPFHKIFIASGKLLQLVSTCWQNRIMLFCVLSPKKRSFVITDLQLKMSSCPVFPTVLFCHIFSCVCGTVVLLSLSILTLLFWTQQVSWVVRESFSWKAEHQSSVAARISTLEGSLSSESL